MLTLVARRAVVQRRLLLGVVALVTAGATLLGVCALLLTATQDRAFTRGMQRTDPADLEVTAFLVSVAGEDARTARQDAQVVITSALAPLATTTTSNAVSTLRQLDSPGKRAYLGSRDDLADQARLTSGRWPAAASGPAAEAVVPDTTARLLRLTVGQHVTLGRETGPTDVRRPVTVVVVGTFQPRSQAGWARDPLAGKGYDAAYNDGRVSGPAYGPFMVTADALLTSGSTVDTMQVTAHPVVGSTSEAALSTVATSVDTADDRLTAVLDGRARISRIASDLPQTLADTRAQQAATRSTVLVVVLLGSTLAAAALVLAGRLLAVFRADERALLLSLGLDRRQLVLAASAEALLLGGLAAVLAVPASALLHSALTRLPAMADAGLAQPPTVTIDLVLTVLVGAVLLAGSLVVPALRAASTPATAAAATTTTTGARGHLALAAASGLDLLLLALAAAGWWQLRSQPPGPASSGDVVRTVAPVLFVVALALVAVRLVPLLFSLTTRPARRSRRLLAPLAAYEAARRPHPVTASVLLAVAAAAGTFALSLGATWERSQVDQAAVQVGTDLTVALAAPPTSGDAAAVTRASGGVVSAVTARPVALGQFLGDRASAPQLVAIDARHAGSLLRGRLDGGRSWQQVGDLLAPPDQVVGVPLPAGGSGLTLSGTAPEHAVVTAAPTLVLQDASGLRTTVETDPVPLDGRRHAPHWRSPIGADQQVVAMRLTLAGDPSSPLPDDAGTGEIMVALRVPGTAKSPAPPSRWTAASLAEQPAEAEAATASVADDGGTTVIRASTRISLAALAYVETDLLASALEAPAAVPVAVSRLLADSVGTKVGGSFTATVSGVDVPVVVLAIVPTVPSAPGQLAVLADADTLSRTLIGAGQLEPVADAWWVGDPKPGAASAVRALGLGEVTTRDERADQLARGPLRVSVSAALVTLVVAAVLLLLAGTALLLTADLETRAVELARLRALGLTRRQVRGLLVGQHGAVLTLLVVLGALVGAVASYALGPSLVRSDLGGAPLQPVLPQWPWPAEAALVAGLVLGCVSVAAGVALVQVRRSDTAHLRTGDA
ncbi:ABC transporter permease [Angustibacter luteus]|uniref:FtsX-like permease family protein n=1 Tax=Angustibacter luteus TaxID=658456 RepID=A0ABW1JG78_9ACTN